MQFMMQFMQVHTSSIYRLMAKSSYKYTSVVKLCEGPRQASLLPSDSILEQSSDSPAEHSNRGLQAVPLRRDKAEPSHNAPPRVGRERTACCRLRCALRRSINVTNCGVVTHESSALPLIIAAEMTRTHPRTIAKLL
jgi:hypothetical protein